MVLLLSIILIAMIIFIFRQHANHIKLTQRLDWLSDKVSDLETKTNFDTPTPSPTDKKISRRTPHLTFNRQKKLIRKRNLGIIKNLKNLKNRKNSQKVFSKTLKRNYQLAG